MSASLIRKALPSACPRGLLGWRRKAKRQPRLRHIAYNALWPEGILNFYILMFGYRELGASLERRKQGKANRFAGDGGINSCHPPVLQPLRRS